MKKLILTNFLILFCLIFSLDIIYYFKQAQTENINIKSYKFINVPKNFSIDNGFYETGEQYTTKKPIILAGCSFAYSFGLKTEETLAYKISKYFKRHVIVKAMCAGGPYETLYIFNNEKTYEDIKEPQYVIYLFIQNHFSRMNSRIYSLQSPKLRPFFDIDDKYNIKEAKFYNDFLFISHLYKWYYRQKYTLNYNIVEEDKLYKVMVALNKLIKKHWKSTQLIFIRFDEANVQSNYKLSKDFINKLEKQGIKYIDADEIVGTEMIGEVYMQEDQHPSSYAMDLLAKNLVKEL